MSNRLLSIALFCLFAVLLGIGFAESWGVKHEWLGYIFLIFTLAIYAVVGLLFRVTDIDGYFLAYRGVPAFKNGIATAADWISAASFIGLSGILYTQGFSGLAYLIGWVGGFCLIAFFIAPFVRASGCYTLADYFAIRYGGGSEVKALRLLVAVLTVLVCLIYVVAQIYGIGLIVTRLTNIDTSVSIFIALASVLICSFLGGMYAITWTQVLQYFVFIAALLLPIAWIGIKTLHQPFPQLAIGSLIDEVNRQNSASLKDPAEQEVRDYFARESNALEEKIKALPQSWEKERQSVQLSYLRLKNSNASYQDLNDTEKKLRDFPKSPEQARIVWGQQADFYRQRATLMPEFVSTLPEQEKDSRGGDDVGKDKPGSTAKGNQPAVKSESFLWLVLCLMFGTASLPHLLSRSYTSVTPVSARYAVFWTVFFILLFYFSMPSLILLTKILIQKELVGHTFTELPGWVHYMGTNHVSDGGTGLNVSDVNSDGILQTAEVFLTGQDVMWVFPQLANMPFFIVALVAVGGLAAALSTADGLLLTIAATFSRDIYPHFFRRPLEMHQHVIVAKLMLLATSMLAAYVASVQTGDIIQLVEVAFSFSTSVFFPSLLLGIFWRRSHPNGAIVAIITGFLTTLGLIVWSGPIGDSYAIAGLIGGLAGFASHTLVSYLNLPLPQK